MQMPSWMMVVAGLFLSFPALAQASEDEDPATEPRASSISETVARVPATVELLNGRKYSSEFLITHFKPAGAGPFPAVLVNHGRPKAGNRHKTRRYRLLRVVRYWTDRGFAVFVPTRLGYGETGTTPDPEFGGACNSRNHDHVVGVAGKQVIATIEFAQQQPWVKRDQIILTGGSVGGITTTHVNRLNIPGVVAAINFAGGAAGDPKNRPGRPCDAPGLTRIFAAAGQGAKTPMLWIYSANDMYWGERLPREWHKAYVAAGGKAEMVVVPPIGEDGHRVMTIGPVYWHPVVDAFIARCGFPIPQRK